MRRIAPRVVLVLGPALHELCDADMYCATLSAESVSVLATFKTGDRSAGDPREPSFSSSSLLLLSLELSNAKVCGPLIRACLGQPTPSTPNT